MTELEQLRQENAHLKEIITEGKNHFKFLNEILGLEKAVDGFGLTLALPKIIRTVQKNPEIFEKLTAYIQKINNIKL
jgi:hypothetical protein